MVTAIILTLLAGAPTVSNSDIDCVRSVYHAMIGDWGPDDPNFNPDIIPAGDWQIFPAREADTYIRLINADASFWTLTPLGADTAHRTATGLEPTARAISLASCQTPDASRPAILETSVEVLSPVHSGVVERIEVTADRLTVIRRSQADSSQVISEDHLRRYNPAPPPSPRPPSRR